MPVELPIDIPIEPPAEMPDTATAKLAILQATTSKIPEGQWNKLCMIYRLQEKKTILW